HGEMKVLPASPLRQAAWRPVPGPSPAIDVPDWAGTGTLHVPGSDSGLVTRAAFKAVWPQANTCGGGFDSHPLPPTRPCLTLRRSVFVVGPKSNTAAGLAHAKFEGMALAFACGRVRAPSPTHPGWKDQEPGH